MNRTPISFFGDNSVIIYLLTQTAPLTSELLRAGYCNMTHYVWWAKKRKQNKQKERLSKYFSLNITLLLRAHASKFWGFLLCSFFFLSFVLLRKSFHIKMQELRITKPIRNPGNSELRLRSTKASKNWKH